MAWVIARIWASVNDPRKGEPRCPLVPKLTSCSGSSRSGRRAKYSRSRAARSTSISFGAGLPASGETVIGGPFYEIGQGFAFQISAAYCAIVRSLENFAGPGHVQNRFAHPCMFVGVQLGQPVIRLEVGSEVREMHVMIAPPSAVRHAMAQKCRVRGC